MIAYRDPKVTQEEKAVILEALLDAFSRFIRLIAKGRWNQFRRVRGEDGLEDIIAAGRLGFITAVHRWLPTVGKPISHYASKWISYSCLGEAVALAQGQMRLPAQIERLIATYKAIREIHGAEVADATLRKSKIREKTIQLIREIVSAPGRRMVGLEGPILGGLAEGTEMRLHDVLADPTQGIHSIEAANMLVLIREYLMTQCTSRERFIMASLHPESLSDEVDCRALRASPTYATAAEHLGLSRERVRQIYNEVKGRLRAHLKHGFEA
jgi:RNA polymerase sigma factor (sigma-70 family)